MTKKKDEMHMVPATYPGKETVGSGTFEMVELHYQQSNSVEPEKIGPTINDGESKDKERLLNKHLKRYNKVWEALA